VKFIIAQIGCIDFATVTVHCHSLLSGQWSEGLRGSNCVTLPNFAEIGQTVAETWRFFDLLRWQRPLSWILKKI